MITAGRLRRFRGADGPIALFRELGYEMAPIDIDVEQWRRAGIEIGWNGDHRLRLLCRMRRFDLFLLEGPPPDGDCIRKFMLSYHSYNVITKSCLIYRNSNDYTISIYDISSAGELRRLDIDLRSPSAHALDRLNLLAAAADSLAMPRIFDRALDRESVTRRFFERFRAAVRNAASALAPQCPRESADDVDAEALLILSRMLFLSFVQEKGWLNGERRFLADRLHAALGTGDEFFATVLAPLFFGCLNTPIALSHGATMASHRRSSHNLTASGFRSTPKRERSTMRCRRLLCVAPPISAAPHFRSVCARSSIAPSADSRNAPEPQAGSTTVMFSRRWSSRPAVSPSTRSRSSASPSVSHSTIALRVRASTIAFGV